MLGTIIGLIIVGAIAGFLARLIVPGKQNLGIIATILLGIVGSFVGGFLGFLLFGSDPNQGFLQPSGIIGSIIGAIIVLLIWVAVTRRSGTRRV
ncbi:MAG TPA: GlsB/YeaQ/YmgE family stress response membrane protein [Naasia sp.]